MWLVRALLSEVLISTGSVREGEGKREGARVRDLGSRAPWQGWRQLIDNYDFVKGFEQILALNVTAIFHLVKSEAKLFQNRKRTR